MNPTGHSNPEAMEDLAAVASTSSSIPKMANRSMTNPAYQIRNNQSNTLGFDSFAGWDEPPTYDPFGIQSQIDGMNSQPCESGVEHSKLGTHPQLKEAYQNPTNQSNYLRSPVGGVPKLSHQHQVGQSLVDQSNSLQSLVGGVPRLSRQHQGDQFQTGQSNSLQSATGEVRLSQQHQGSLFLADHSNSVQSPTGGVRLSQQHQGDQFQASQSNSLLSAMGGVRLSQQHQGTLFLADHSNSVQSPTGGVRLSQQHQGDQFQAGQSNSLQSAMGEVRLSQQHQGSLFLADNPHSVQSPTGGVRLSQQHQGDQFQAGKSNSLQSEIGGVRLSQEHQGFLFLADHSNSVQSPTSGVRFSQQHQGDHFQAGQSKSLQSAMGEVRLSQQPLNQVGQSHTDLSNPPQCTSGRMTRSEETRQPQWSQRETSQDSRLTTSESGNTLTAEERKKKADREYKQRERDRKALSAEMFDKLRRGEDVRFLEYGHRIPEPPRKSKSQRPIHQPSFSAPAVDHHEDSGKFGQDHRGTDPGDIGQTRTGLEKVRTAVLEMKQLSASVKEIKQIRQNSSSWLQPNVPHLAQAGQSTIEQLHHSKFDAQVIVAADHGYQTIDHNEKESEAPDQFGGSQMSNDDHDPHMTASTSSAAGLPKNFNAEDIAVKSDNAKRGAKGGFNIDNFMRLHLKGKSSDSNQQFQGAQISKSKASLSFESVKTSQKRQYCVIDAGPSTTLSERDSAFEDTSVARKIFASMLSPTDKEMMNAPSFANASYSVRQAFLTLAHTIKVEEFIEQIERKNNEYHDRALSFENDLKLAEAEKKKAKVSIEKLQGEVKHLNEELAKAKKEKTEAVETALASFRETKEYCARKGFALCLHEVQHIYPDINLSMISIDALKTAGNDYDDSNDGNGEGNNNANTDFIVAAEMGNNDRHQDC